MSADEAGAAIAAWIKKYGQASVPVLVDGNTHDEYLEFTHQSPFLSGTADSEQCEAMIRVGITWRCVALSRIKVHRRAKSIMGLATSRALPDSPELEFRPPDCPFCEISLGHDGDGWTCEQCHARWPGNGYSAGAVRICVEEDCAGNEAQVLGEDGQPRCLPCAGLILLGVLEPTEPYKCRETYCSENKVTGMPAWASAAQARRCGRHQAEHESQQRWENYQRTGSFR